MEDLILSLADNHFFYNDLEVRDLQCPLDHTTPPAGASAQGRRTGACPPRHFSDKRAEESSDWPQTEDEDDHC